MKIAIVDDSSLDRDFLKNGLEIIFEERNIENLEIQEFSSGEELLNYLRDNLSRTKISRKAHFSRVTEVVECRQMCWNLHRMQHICSRYATKILICIGHFSVEILGNVLFFV